jgi:hypothetical protein
MMASGAASRSVSNLRPSARALRLKCFTPSSQQADTSAMSRITSDRLSRTVCKADISDVTLLSVAECWAERTKAPIEDAAKALRLLRDLFRHCARPRKTLLDAPSLLERRVGLLKYHADRQAAHITLEPFLFHLIDLVHVVAAVAVVGAMIIDFDDATRGTKYFDSIDEAGWDTAKALFPTFPIKRLFQNFAIHEQAKIYWRVEQLDGLDMLLNQLPAAIGYWDSTNEVDLDENSIPGL